MHISICFVLLPTVPTSAWCMVSPAATVLHSTAHRNKTLHITTSGHIAHTNSPVQAEILELEALEAELIVNDVLLFRTMAERKQQGSRAAPPIEGQPEEEEVFQDATEVM